MPYTAAEPDLLRGEARVSAGRRRSDRGGLPLHAWVHARRFGPYPRNGGGRGTGPTGPACAGHGLARRTIGRVTGIDRCRFSKELSSRTAVTSADVRCLIVLSRRLSQRSAISFRNNALASARPRSTRRMSALPEGVSTAQSETAGCLRDNRPCGLAGHTIALMKA